jgi:uncharacterized protein
MVKPMALVGVFTLVLGGTLGLLFWLKPGWKAPTNTHAQLLPAPGTKARGLVWRVTKGQSQLYLAGSVHMLTDADLPLPAAYDTAVQASQKVIFELSPEGSTAEHLAQALAEYGTVTKSDLTPEAAQSLQNWSTKAGVPMQPFQTQPAWRIATSIAALASKQLGMKPENGLDHRLRDQATGLGKEIGGLETAAQQFQCLAGISPASQSAMVVTACQEYTTAAKDVTELLGAWRAGDLSALQTRIDRSFAPVPEARAALLEKRNAQWWPQIAALLDSPPVETIVVGSAHLIGPQGLLQRLQAAGATLEQL